MMATTAGGGLRSHGALYPAPLFIQKKQRKATFGRRMLRKSNHATCNGHDVFGPLDDIIDRIKSAIWNAPPAYSLDQSVNDWTNPLKAPSTWTVTSLPVSRIPSDQPLTVRKNRNSRSSGSGSSMGGTIVYSQSGSQKTATSFSRLTSSLITEISPSLSLDTPALCEPTPLPARSSRLSVNTKICSAQKALENVIQQMAARPETGTQRPSRLRLFTNGFSRSQRTSTEDTGRSTCEKFTSPSPIDLTSLENSRVDIEAQELEEAFESADLRKDACENETSSAMKLISNGRLTLLTDDQHNTLHTRCLISPRNMPTTLRAAVRIFPETEVISEASQDLALAAEIEGVLHNRQMRPDPTIDVILLLDIGYYVTKECLNKALDGAREVLSHLSRGDRVALYTTHSTHSATTGNGPDELYSLRPISTNIQQVFHNLTCMIAGRDIHAWNLPLPNTCMSEIIIKVARSFQHVNCKFDRTHMILLSPATHLLHDVSKSFPDLYVHQINPAILPYYFGSKGQEILCTDKCCQKISLINLASYQSIPLRIKQIVENARAERPVGELTEVSIDIQTKDGCQILECSGGKNIPVLRLGQIHTFLAKIRIGQNQTQDVGPKALLLSSSMSIQGLGRLQTPSTISTAMVHLLDIQALHRNSLHAVDCWNYTETPLQVVRQAGGLTTSRTTAVEVYRRQYFHQLVQLGLKDAHMQAETLLYALDSNAIEARSVLEPMVEEIRCHQANQNNENHHR